MSTPLPPDRDDQLPGEAELAALYRKLPASEPGPALDAAVLRAAAQALSENGAAHNARARRPTRWLIPLSTAATLVLAAGLAWHMRGMPVAETATVTASTPAAAPTTAPESAAPIAPAQDRVAAPTPPPPPPPAQAIAMTEPAKTADKVEYAQPPRQPAPRLHTQSAARMSKLYTPNLIAKAYKPDQAEPAQDQSSGVVASGELRKEASVRADALAAAPAVSNASQNMSAEVVMSAPAPAPAPAPAAPPVLAETAAVAAPQDNAKDQAVDAESRMMVAPRLLPATEPRADDTPAQELVKIRLLFALHRDDEAQKRLAAFQHQHPDEILPDDLRAHLPARP